MQNICTIRSLCALGLLWLATGSIPLSAQGKGPLALCLNDAQGEPDACETENCRVEACKRAAEIGHAKAIVLIGMAHVHGRGVQKDHVKAYTYFRVLHRMSATLDEREREEAREYSERILSELRDHMSPEEVARAETLARQWMANQAQEISDLRMRRQIERALVLQGFSSGKRDGEFDRRTQEAIRVWQRVHGHAVTGELTNEQRESLLAPRSPCDSLVSRTAESSHGSLFFSQLDDGGETFGIAWSDETAEGARQAARTECMHRGGAEGAKRGARSATPVGRSRAAIRV